MSTASVAGAIAAADAGPVLTGELFPVNGTGKVRVTYNWLYSALNCDPGDASAFGWVLAKTPDGNVSLSPQQPYAGMTLFASVRPDWSYYVQVQAPGSADWITAAQGDEEMAMTELGLLTIELQGVNGSYVGVNSSPTPHDGHTGYKLQSNVGVPDTSSRFFVAVTQTLQGGLTVPLAATLSRADVEAELAAQGVSDSAEAATRILAATEAIAQSTAID